MLFISPMMMAPMSGFSHTSYQKNGHFSFSNTNVLIDTLGPIFGSYLNRFCPTDNDCVSYRCNLTKEVFKNVSTICENNLSVTWIVAIDLYNDGLIDYEYRSDLPVGNDVANVTNGLSDAIKDDNGDGIKDIYFAPTSYGEMVTLLMPENALPKGSSHKIVWTTTDICGNTSEDIEIISIKDKKEPTPVCVPLSTVIWMDIDGDGPLSPSVELAAIDFINKAFDNCTADEDLFYTFDNVSPQLLDKAVFGKTINRSVAHYFNLDGALAAYPVSTVEEKAIEFRYLDGEPGYQLWDPIRQSSSIIKSCKRLLPEEDLSYNDVMVTVWDEELNYDFCWTRINVKCFGPYYSFADLNGNVRSVTGANVKNGVLIADSNLPEFPKLSLTNKEGKYAFSKFNASFDYTITGRFLSNEMQGLDYNDLTILNRHVTGSKLITNPYQLIAADINGDNVVDQKDYIMLKSSLETKSEAGFTTNKCVVKSSNLNTSNWYNYTESVVHLLSADVFGIDFVAIKIGDINGSHFSTGIINYDLNVSERVSSGPEITDRSSGKEYTNQITLSPNPFTDITTLSFFAPKIGEYVLLITDLAGRAVYSNQFEAEEGSNTIKIESNLLGVAGSYICTLKSEDLTVNKRLVLIR